MPGLLRGIARTSVIAGTATAVSGRVARRQRDKYAERDAATAYERDQAYQRQAQQHEAPQAPSTSSTDNMIERLQQLGKLKEQGILTDEEFAAAKAKALGI